MSRVDILTWRELSQSALENNLQTIQTYLTPKTELCACVKGDAYGHGLIEMAHILDQYLDWLAVFSFDEFQQLIEERVTARILILGRVEDKNIDYVITHQGRFYGYSQEYVKCIFDRAQMLEMSAFLHIPIETGMGRLGLPHQEASMILKEWSSWQYVDIEGIVQHFATADEDEYVYYQEQQDVFAQVLHEVKNLAIPYIHADNSAAVISHGQTQSTNIVRVGASLYGFSSSKEVTYALEENQSFLQPVLSWRTNIISVKTLPAGHGVSYGAQPLARDTDIAVLPVGYADGYDRRLSEGGYVLIQGQKCSIVGTICMNMTMVDVSHLAVEVGQEVTLVGKQGNCVITGEELASFMGTIPYEVLTNIQTPAIVWKE